MYIAFQGAPGAYSDLAGRQFAAGQEIGPQPVETFAAVVQAVIAGRADLGVLPLENSLSGSLHVNLDLLLVSDLAVVGEVILPIEQHLWALPGVAIAGVREVWSSPQGLETCSTFLAVHPGLRRIAAYDSAGAARQLRDEGRTDAAAIASELAGNLYGLHRLAEGIQDAPQNSTRYWVVGRPQPPYAGPDAKTSLVFGFKDAPGALFKCLSIFALRNINLFKLESRPIQGRPWEYLFYLDLEGSLANEGLARACETLREVTTYYRALGSYRRDS
jgi:prephenate dehydratase